MGMKSQKAFLYQNGCAYYYKGFFFSTKMKYRDLLRKWENANVKTLLCIKLIKYIEKEIAQTKNWT